MSAAAPPVSLPPEMDEKRDDQTEGESLTSSLSSLHEKRSSDVADETEKPRGTQQTSFQDAGIDEACQLVQAILDQVTLNDSPPVNDEVAPMTIPPSSLANTDHRSFNKRQSPSTISSHDSTVCGTLSTESVSISRSAGGGITSAPRYSRQRHVLPQSGNAETGAVLSPRSRSLASANGGDRPLSPVASGSESSTDPSASTLSSSHMGTDLPSEQHNNNDDDPGSLWMAQYRQRETRSERKMGNVALATLCARTLDSVVSTQEVPSPEEEMETEEATTPKAISVPTKGKSTELRVQTMTSTKPSPLEPTGFKVVDSSSVPLLEKNPQISSLRSSPRKGSPLKHLRPLSPAQWRRKKEDGCRLDLEPKAETKAPTKQGWLSKRVSRKRFRNNKKHGSEDVRSPKHNDDKQQRADNEEPLRQLENLPPTPTRSNTDKGSVDLTGSAMREFCVEEEIVNETPGGMTVLSQAESHDDEVHLHEDADLVVDRYHHEDDDDDDAHELLNPSSSGELLHIQEETEADMIAEEKGQRNETYPHEAKRAGRHAPAAKPANGKAPRARIQMFGSEYARFLSSTPFAPTSPQSRAVRPSFSRASASSGRQRQFRSASVGHSNGVSSKGRPLNLEDATDSVLTGAITDIIVTHGSEIPPKGYYRISQTGSGEDFTALSRQTSNGGVLPGRKSTQVYINVKKESSWDRAAQRPCVTALAVIFPGRREFVPPGFCVVRRYKGQPANDTSAVSSSSQVGSKTDTTPANLNFGSASAERVYLCYRRSREGNPMTGIIPLQPTKGEVIPEGYTVLERTPRNFVADMNSKAGPPVFLAFRQRLANLEPLRPLPLVLSVHYSNDSGNGIQSQLRKKCLRAYYCTGGTIVSSEVGRFHIMDRSTHSLLSPSSVSNRLSLIEASRRQRSSTTNGSDVSSTPIRGGSTYASSADLSTPERTMLARGQRFTPCSSVSDFGLAGEDSVVSDFSADPVASKNSPAFVKRRSSSNDGFSIGGSSHGPGNHCRRPSYGTTMSDLSGTDGPFDVIFASETLPGESVIITQPSIFSHEDVALQSCFVAMDFIPTIETAEGFLADGNDDTSALLRLQTRVAVLTPILTACYTHHGGSAHVAVEGLSSLLHKTDFFKADLTISTDADSGPSSRLTLLDLATQAVCDVATCSSRETSFGACVEFVASAMRLSGGQLNTRTIGYALRFYLFIFYFGASIPSASAKWPNPVWRPATVRDRKLDSDQSMQNSEDDVPLLYEEPFDSDEDRIDRFLPGGAPQAAALALKELISLTLIRLRKLSSCERKEFVDIVQETSSYFVQEGNKPDLLDGFVQTILSSLIDGAVDRVDIANYTQLAIHQIHRSGGSELFWHDMMTSCGVGLFGTDTALGAEGNHVYSMSFALLANLVKVSSAKIRTVSQTSELVPRDVASKLLSMELLHHFLQRWGEEQSALSGDEASTKALKSVDTMAYSIRRLVVPCLLWNTRFGLEDHHIFRRMLRIVSELWCTPYYRHSMKMELGVLIEHFVVRMLQLGPQLLPPLRMHELASKEESSRTASALFGDIREPLLSQQCDILLELKRWFAAEPKDVIELFLNFDLNCSVEMDMPSRLLPDVQWKIGQELCGSLCTLAEQSGDTIGEQIRLSQAPGSGATQQNASPSDDRAETAAVCEGARSLQQKSLEAIGQVAKSLAESAASASGESYQLLLSSWSSSGMDSNMLVSNSIRADDTASIPSISSPRADNSPAKRSPPTKSWKSGFRAKDQLSSAPEHVSSSPRARSLSPLRRVDHGDLGIMEYWHKEIVCERRKPMMASPGLDHRKRGRQHKRGRSASPIRQHHSGEADLSSPMSPASSRQGGAKAVLNDAKPVDTSEASQDVNPEAEEMLEVAFDIVRTKSLKKALGYLVACNFLTPSPRDIASFLRIHKARLDPAILGDYLGEGGEDDADFEYRNLIRFNYVQAISFVGMNVEQGLRYFLTNCGFRLPGEAQKIDRIMTTFSQCYWEDNAGDLQRCPFHDQDTVFLLSFAIIMLNTDLHKVSPATPTSRRQRKKMTKAEFLNNLRGVDNSEDLTRDYLSSIYDSIEKHPIEIMDDQGYVLGSVCTSSTILQPGRKCAPQTDDLVSLLKSMIKHVKPTEELLRGLSVHDYPFHNIEEQKDLGSLVRTALGASWHHFHGTINAALDKAHMDPQGMESCLDILKYALCATICLDMVAPKNAFVSVLARCKLFKERPDEWLLCRDSTSYKVEDWFVNLEMDTSDPLDQSAKLSALAQVHSMIEELRSSLKLIAGVKKDMHRVVRRIRNGEFLFNDPARSFLKEGDLVKRSIRSGRGVTGTYRFFLFSDVLIYTKASSSSDYKIHEELPLYLMEVVDYFQPSEKKKHLKRSFQIHHPRKSFLVEAASVEERKEWVESLRGAIAVEVQRRAQLERVRLASSFESRADGGRSGR